ncbi:hypothetical protein AB5J62_03355 [Amycolatopsis sp. cg5]|uniref:hypothetical protein n=1 Tax=Amycolatopsis sp. cg5 TaxID=3238802 RepID=UPI00352602AD
MDLQRDIQSAISSKKRMLRKDENAHTELHNLRDIRWQARRFGDAIAWILLGNNPQLIYPLASNDPVAIGGDDHGDRGVLAISSELSNHGWGFPLLHDITDCLRIGDITFVSPGKNHRTVEVKTHLIDEELLDDGHREVRYEVNVLFIRDDMDEVPLIGEGDPGLSNTKSAMPRMHLNTPRIERQFERMASALQRQKMQHNSLSEIDNMPTISLTVPMSKSGHWRTLRRVMRNARKNGYFTEVAEDTFLYVGIYCAGGVTEEAIKDSRVVDDLRNSGILTGDATKDSIGVYSVPTKASRGPQLYLPYFIYSISQWAVLDLLRRRLVVIVIMNRARIYEALERAGYKVDPALREGFQSLSVSVPATEKEGYFLEFKNLEMHVLEMIYEFRTLDSLVSVIDAMKEASKIHEVHRMRSRAVREADGG